MVLSDLIPKTSRNSFAVPQHVSVTHQRLKLAFICCFVKDKKVDEKRKQINWNHGAERLKSTDPRCWGIKIYEVVFGVTENHKKPKLEKL